MIKTITSPPVALIGFALAMILNLPHMVDLYDWIKPLNTFPYWVKYSGFAVLEFGILILAVNGKSTESKTFAWMVFFANLVYYWYDLAFVDLLTWETIRVFAVGVIYSAAVAYLIFYFSHLFAGYVDRENWRNDEETVRNQLENKRNESERMRNTIERLQNQNESNRKNTEQKISELESQLSKAEKAPALMETAMSMLERELGYFNYTESTRKKYIQQRKARLNANGIDSPERKRLELEILLLEK